MTVISPLWGKMFFAVRVVLTSIAGGLFASVICTTTVLTTVSHEWIGILFLAGLIVGIGSGVFVSFVMLRTQKLINPLNGKPQSVGSYLADCVFFAFGMAILVYVIFGLCFFVLQFFVHIREVLYACGC